MKKRLILFAGLIFLMQCVAFSQGQPKRFYHLTNHDGLSQSTVQAILQDSEGYMWFGTQDGLNKFDGYEFTVYAHNPNDPSTIGDSNIRAIYEDLNGDLWFGTQTNGLSKYDKDRDHFINYKGVDEEWETVSSNTVWTILEDSQGIFWVGTGDGLNIFDRNNETFQRIYSDRDDPSTLSDNDIRAIYEDSRGTLWIGTSDGLNRLNRETGEFTPYLEHEGQDYRERIGMIRTIFEDRYGMLWIGTEDKGVLRFDVENETFTQFIHDPEDPFSYSDVSCFDILEDSRGELWFATGNRGINLFDREEEVFYQYEQNPEDPFSLNNNGILQIYESRENIVWVGTFAGGINYFEMGTEVFSHFINEPQNPQSLSNNVIQALHETENGDVWVGTDGGGLNIFNPETEVFRRLGYNSNNPGNPSSDVILDFRETPDGIWLATYGEGVDFYNFDEEQFVNFRHEPGNTQSLSNNYVFDIFESSDGHLWFSTNWGGVTEFNPHDETYHWYNPNPENPEDITALQNESARSVYEDNSGDIWIGTYGGYLHRMDRETGQFRVYNINEHSIFYGSVVQAIYEDDLNRLWLGTRGAGLMMFDRDEDRLVSFANTDQYLPSNTVHTILEDQNGHLWLSTNNGLSRFNPETGEFRHINQDSGLINREFLPGSALLDREGNLYFGGVLGFHKFHPDSVRQDTTINPVVLTDLLLNNEPVPIADQSPLQQHINRTEQLVLPFNTSVITIAYTALNYSPNKGDRFAYMLEGFDEDWNYVGTQRRATYTNLSPGNYIFKVRSANPDGVWGEEYASLAIQITPPFWLTGWFIVLMVILGTLLIFGIYRIRVQQIRIQKIRLEKKVQERTEELRKANETKNKLFSILGHDLRNYGSSLIGFTTLLKESAQEDNLDEMKEYSTHLDQAANQFMNFLQNLLDWARNQQDKIQYRPEPLEVEKIMSHALSKVKSAANKKNISIISAVPSGLKIFADTNMLSIAIFNFLNNAIKFSHEESKIEISAHEHDEEFVQIIIRDYGVGMDQETLQKLLNDNEYISQRGTSGEKGTGLGFSLSKNLIIKNKGTLNIESEKGEGTTIKMMIPAAQKKAKPKSSSLPA